jgi:hypothetical protein
MTEDPTETYAKKAIAYWKDVMGFESMKDFAQFFRLAVYPDPSDPLPCYKAVILFGKDECVRRMIKCLEILLADNEEFAHLYEQGDKK